MTDAASMQRVVALRKNNPDKGPDELVDNLIRMRCLQVGGVGAATAGLAALPSLGMITAITGGSLIDLSSTNRLQVELLMDIATIYGYQFKPGEQQRYMIVALGVNTGNPQGNSQSATEQLISRGGQQLAQQATQRLAKKSVGRALPVIGAATSAGSNMMMTYAVGQRAKAYITTGPDSVGNLESSLGTALNELKRSDWTAESLSKTMTAISDAMIEGFDQGAQQAGRAAGRATRKLINFWRNATTPKE